MATVREYLANGAELRLETSRYYAAILGERPSKGARSPKLWNSALRAQQIDAVMHPFDIPDPRDLPHVISALRADPRFIGGAVTMPHKSAALELLDEVEPEARKVGAINAIYRKGTRLVGANTDGEGAVTTLAAAMPGGSLAGRRALLLGLGGAGRAVSVYLAQALGSGGRLWIANRTNSRSAEFQAILNQWCPSEVCPLPIPRAIPRELDLMINCTSIGFGQARVDGTGSYTLLPYSPLAAVEAKALPAGGSSEAASRSLLQTSLEPILSNLRASLSHLLEMPPGIVLDIIYQPETTALLHQASMAGHRIMNGKPMNLEQAVIAYRKVLIGAGLDPAPTTEKIRKWMSEGGE